MNHGDTCPTVTFEEIRRAIRLLDLAGTAVCVHASMRSFGFLEGGATALVEAILSEGCTLLVPTFTYHFAVAPSRTMRLPRNGYDYDSPVDREPNVAGIYDPDKNELTREHMGALPAAVLARADRMRGNHPVCSFSALGPKAHDLVAAQRPDDVYAPLRMVRMLRGAVILMGVGLNRMTLVHLAEEVAGRTLFRRWAKDRLGRVQMITVGSCSEGFHRLAPALADTLISHEVGPSQWQVYPLPETVDVLAETIRRCPELTHCGDTECLRCKDAVAGGPIIGQTCDAPDLRTGVTAFVREHLGCGCPEEVFNSIVVTHFPEELLGLGVEYLCDIGRRLLVVVCILDCWPDLLPELERLVDACVAQRDRGGYNRVRLVIPASDADAAATSLEPEFTRVAAVDDRCHLHVVEPCHLSFLEPKHVTAT